MRIVDPSFEILDMKDGSELIKFIERIGRTCYKSEDKITFDSAVGFVQRLIKNGHHSVLEHAHATVRIVCDRGVTHELVRHRLASFSQESTRYVRYGDERELTFIRPFWLEITDVEYQLWEYGMKECEYAYNKLLKQGQTPQQARSVLPNSLKTEIVVTANMREWRHIFKLRCDKAAHPQMRQIMIPILKEFDARCPVLFDDIVAEVASNA